MPTGSNRPRREPRPRWCYPGGGLLGLKAGNGLRKLGLKVLVVEFFPRLLPRQMDAAGAAILARQLEDMGFTFYLGAKTQEIAPGPTGLTVNLESGRSSRVTWCSFPPGCGPTSPGPGPGA